MKKKINLNKIIDIIYWSIVIIMAFKELDIGGLKNINISDFSSINLQNISIVQYVSIFLAIIFMCILTVLVTMLRLFYITIIYFGIKIANKKYSKERLEKVDLKNDNYYREILPKYSPAVLSYLDDFKIGKEDVIATILMLELKQKIKIQDENIIFLDETTEQLEENEKYIFNKLKEKDLNSVNILEYTNLVKKDALKGNLLQEKNDVKENIKKRIIANIVICVIAITTFVITANLLETTEGINTNIIIIALLFQVILFMLILFIPFVTIVYINHYKILNTLDPYVRNEEGKQINIKLEGLRKYLTEFSKIEEKNKEQLILWEEYLIYSIILGINTKIVEDMYQKLH